MTAYLVSYIIHDPGTSPGCANECILGDVYLRSNLSRIHAFRVVADDLNVLLDVSKSVHGPSRKPADMDDHILAACDIQIQQTLTYT